MSASNIIPIRTKDRGAMQNQAEQPVEQAMYILGQIGAVICHDHGPRPNTSILTKMASRPAEGLWFAVARMDELCPPQRGSRRTLLRWKHEEIGRLSRLLPHPLPADACAKTQMPFWAGYCQYWEDVLKQHVQRDIDRLSIELNGLQRKSANL